jgi:hypothetical protein
MSKENFISSLKMDKETEEAVSELRFLTSVMGPKYFKAFKAAIEDKNKEQFIVICRNAGVPDIIIARWWDIVIIYPCVWPPPPTTLDIFEDLV